MTDVTVKQGAGTPAPAAPNEFPAELKGIEPRDLVVFVSLLGSVLAIVYDTGFFWGLDLSFFTFFTIAEHLLFALEAIPITLLVVFMVLLLVGEITSSQLREEQFLKSGGVTGAPMPAWKRRVLLVVTSLLSLGVGYKLLRQEQAYTFATAMVLFTILFVLGFESVAFRRKIVWIPAAAFCLILLVFVYGIEIGDDYARTTWVTHSIYTKAEPSCFTARIVRSGASGVLFVDQPARQLSLVRWEDIKRITAHKPGEPAKC